MEKHQQADCTHTTHSFSLSFLSFFGFILTRAAEETLELSPLDFEPTRPAGSLPPTSFPAPWIQGDSGRVGDDASLPL